MNEINKIGDEELDEVNGGVAEISIDMEGASPRRKDLYKAVCMGCHFSCTGTQAEISAAMANHNPHCISCGIKIFSL